MYIFRHNKGFTLLELITTLFLIGLLSGIAGLVIGNIVDSYSLSKKNAEDSHKTRLAVLRLINEFMMMNTVDEGGPKSITIRSRFNNMEQRRIRFQNRMLRINKKDDPTGAVLIDNVEDFNLEYIEDSLNNSQQYWTKKTTAIRIYLKIERKLSENSNASNEFRWVVVPRYLAEY